MSGLDPETIRHALSAAHARGCVHVRVRQGCESFTARLAPGSAAGPEPVGEEFAVIGLNGEPENEGLITSPVVGYFRETQDAVEPGLLVKAGGAVAEVVALGIANELVSPVDGEVTEVLVRPGEAVDYGQLIARVRKG